MSKENRLVLGLIILAYAFSYLLHIYWIHWASNYPQFFWHSQLMINNPDGYFFGSGAQKIAYGMHLDNPRLLDVFHYGTAVITAYLAKFFHLSIDTLMLYLPPVISSLVVIPVILIGKLYKNLTWGFLAALIASIGWSYYNRTLAGYYDTDMFSASLPMFILYFILLSLKEKSLFSILLASFTVILYPWAYGQGLSIIYAMGIMAFLYLLIFQYKDKFTYEFIAIFSFALMEIYWGIRIIGVIGLYYLFKYKDLKIKYLQILSGILFIGFFITGNVLGIILIKVFDYSTATQKIEGLKFLNVNKTVREASHIPWFIVFDRIIGSVIGLLIAIVGYILLVKKHKEFIIALPLWGIGFFAFIGGLRFTVYAVAIAALSGVYFFVWLVEKLKIKNEKFRIAIVVLGSLFLIVPNITHICGCCENNRILASFEKFYPLRSYPYLVPTVFNKNEVEVLNKLKQISNPKDYVITWWDYGYPIWYYANVNTLIDGGKHNEDDFLVSKILTTSNQYLAANLSKISIKKYIETNKTVAPQLFIKNKKPINVDEFLDTIGNKNFKAPKLNRDVYLMLPYRMFNIFPTISEFSNRNLNSGEVYPPHFFYKAKIYKKGPLLYIGQIPIDLQKGIVLIRNGIPIKEIDIVGYNKNGKLIVKKQKLRDKGLDLIVLESYGEALLVDDYYYNSTFIQMFVFNNYNRNLFKPVILNPLLKIYKIK